MKCRNSATDPVKTCHILVDEVNEVLTLVVFYAVVFPALVPLGDEFPNS